MRDERFWDDVREPIAWLRQVVVHLAVSRLRRRAVWERLRGFLPGGADETPNPDLHDAIRRLPPTQRGAIVLRYYFDADYREIAQALGLAESSIARTLARARATLRRELV